MNQSNTTIAHSYYTAMGARNIAGIKKYLHPNVDFTGPIATTTGKEAVVEAVKKFMTYFTSLTIRSTLGNQDQAMVVYDVDFPAPIGTVPTAALMTIHDGLIVKIELFFDTKPFAKP